MRRASGGDVKRVYRIPGTGTRIEVIGGILCGSPVDPVYRSISIDGVKRSGFCGHFCFNGSSHVQEKVTRQL